MLRQYIKRIQKYIDAHPNSTFCDLYDDDACMAMVRTLFYPNINSEEFVRRFNQGLFEKPDYKAFLEEYFGVDLSF